MDLISPFDADLPDQRLQERLLRGCVAVADRLRDFGLEGGDVVVCQDGVSVVSVVGQLFPAGLEACELAGERIDPLAAELLGHRAVLEGGEVAIERGVGSRDLGVELRALLFRTALQSTDIAWSAAIRAAADDDGSNDAHMDWARAWDNTRLENDAARQAYRSLDAEIARLRVRIGSDDPLVIGLRAAVGSAVIASHYAVDPERSDGFDRHFREFAEAAHRASDLALRRTGSIVFSAR